LLTAKLITKALELYETGRLQNAAVICKKILRADRDQVDALHLLGAIACQQDHHDKAVELISRALAAGGSHPQLYNSLGLAQMGQGNLEAAEASFKTAIQLDPEFGLAHNNIATALRRMGRFLDALASHRRAVELVPGSARAHCNMGSTLQAFEEPAGAVVCFERALELTRNSPEALLGLGVALHCLGRLEAAVDNLRKAATLAPRDPLAHVELGDALQTQRQYQQAILCYQRALLLEESLVRARYGLGCAQAAMGDHADAVASFRRLLSWEPHHFPAVHNLGKSLLILGQADEAMDCFRQAAAVQANPLSQMALAAAIPGSPKADQMTILDVRRDYAWQLVSTMDTAARFPEAIAPIRRPLRIGYLSGFFHKRNWMKPVWGLINHHDRDRFEIHLFSDAPESQVTGGYDKHFADHFYDTSRISNHDLAGLIKNSRIDLLVDLNGYSMPERLPVFLHKPAPTIVGWFNMYATTGMTCFDYLIGDAQVILEGEEQFYTERLVRIAGSYLTFAVAYAVPDVAPPPCLKNGYFTFGSLASQYKITPEVAAAWSAILKSCPESKLVLKNTALGSSSNRSYIQRLFAGLGITAERLGLEGPSEHYEFLRTYDQIDLALDTFPYNGGTTTTEAIWQGVPVLTFAGDRWAARTSASLLRNCHLSDFVAGSLREYVEQAIEWARQPQSPARLMELRATMRERLRASPVCDTGTFARNMEAEYARMCDIAGHEVRS
jgi:protein O-GlcNAc transferase